MTTHALTQNTIINFLLLVKKQLRKLPSAFRSAF
ncbi:Protein of unknown function [Lactobacillus helveticus CIRM-BIA 101]|uniref:Uncharacterized protein n=2 Tax=Lactobacillus helveticus TaxID=1587 RepID=U6FD80_LACHE|nr:Protein of unknown function [Lactobacillus helveticus CIRM-BIA 951]CDI61005.1 Protein of unknown function [Lactobacillus helveticus CIRM-BIA 104]CDI63232.1 Protein of unknown function [Lactobacillus helveticus CIRM-BIA 103]CDI66057.1 Protein of unknown function [Lactobacillus helveticus CIRM-BIA 101]